MEQLQHRVNVFYDGDASRLLDIAKGSIVFDTVDEFNHARTHLKSELQKFAAGAEIVRVKNRFDTPTISGYRDMIIHLRMPNGHIAELQFHLKPLLALKDEGRKVFEAIRDIEKKSVLERRKLSLAEINTIETLQQEARALYNQAFEKALKK